jgi:hypothetical protein
MEIRKRRMRSDHFLPAVAPKYELAFFDHAAYSVPGATARVNVPAVVCPTRVRHTRGR